MCGISVMYCIGCIASPLSCRMVAWRRRLGYRFLFWLRDLEELEALPNKIIAGAPTGASTTSSGAS